MVVCGRCCEEVSSAIQCSSCRKFFDFPCSGITEVGYRKLGDRQATWRCASCKVGHLSSRSESPLPEARQPTLDTIMFELQKLSCQLTPLQEVINDIRSIKNDISELRKFNENVKEKMDTFDKRIQAIENANQELSSLKLQLRKLEDDVNEKDQWLRSNNVEIKGVPFKPGENLFDIIDKLGNKITYPVPKNAVNYVTRVQTRDTGSSNTKPIIVSFTNKYMKEDFIAASRHSKLNISAEDIGLKGKNRIYINDHLSYAKKMLLNKTKTLTKEKNYQYVWVKHGKIFVRKTDTSYVFNIKSESDLVKIN
ncbi:unnamed protein product [Parnassius mnemosyne]|uniref:FP protein C-terminal domain-containing protein n=1 Tax=Parnassius mnemosyne TaxID=213953 RepID=A0AAV1KRR9_9NEOP